MSAHIRTDRRHAWKAAAVLAAIGGLALTGCSGNSGGDAKSASQGGNAGHVRAESARSGGSGGDSGSNCRGLENNHYVQVYGHRTKAGKDVVVDRPVRLKCDKDSQNPEVWSVEPAGLKSEDVIDEDTRIRVTDPFYGDTDLHTVDAKTFAGKLDSLDSDRRSQLIFAAKGENAGPKEFKLTSLRQEWHP